MIGNIFKSLNNEASIDYLHAIIRSDKISSSHGSRILENLFDYFFECKLKDEDWDFLIALCYVDFFNEKLNKKIWLFLNTLINADSPNGNRLWELLMILTEFDPKIKFQNFKFLYNFIENSDNEDTLKKLFDFVDQNSIEDEKILMQITTLLELHLKSIVSSNDFDIDYSKYVKGYYNPDGYSDYDIDTSGIENEISAALDFDLNEFNSNVLEKISFDTSDIISSIDIDNKVTSYIENYESDTDSDIHDDYSAGRSGEDDIDAIFERS